MARRSLVLAASAALLSCSMCLAAEQDTFVRPNEDEECGSPMDFLAYAAGLANTECGPEQCEYKEKSATLFDMKYRKNYKIVEYKDSPENFGEDVDGDGDTEPSVAVTYILYQCGAEKPNDKWIQDRVAANTSELHFLEIPLTAVATEDSTVGWFLEELGVLDRVRFAPSTGTSPCMQKIAAAEESDGCGRKFEGSFADEPTNTTEFDAAFGFSPDVEGRVVYFQAVADPGPLARAEHIVYISSFFNMEAKAEEYYQKVADAYTDKAQAVEASADAPVVAWAEVHVNGSTSFIMDPEGNPIGEGPALKMSFTRYKTLITRDAGGALPVQSAVLNTNGAFASNDEIIFAASEYASEAGFFQAVGSALEGVDILIDESYQFDPSPSAWTSADILGALGLNGTNVNATAYPFIDSENIWRHDKARSVDGNDDWFGEAVARPDVVHSDLKEIITPGSVPNHTLKFFRNVSKGENVTEVGPDACTELTCNAYDQQKALTGEILTGAEAPEELEGAEGDSEGTEVTEGSYAARALASGAVIAAVIFAIMA